MAPSHAILVSLGEQAGAGYGDAGTLSALRTPVLELRRERAAQLDVYRGFTKDRFPDPSVEWLDDVLAAIGVDE